MKSLNKNDLAGMARFVRANLINCLTGTKPALLIGSASQDGITNLAMFSSVVHLGADPALIAFVQRPLTEYSHTYRNILATGYYTFNHVTSDRVAEAHHTSAKFPDGQSEFASCGFEELFVDGFPAPFVKNSPVVWGMKFIREVPFPENDTRLIVGEVEKIILADGVLLEDGNLDLELAKSVSAIGLETYASIKTIDKYAYAKHDKRPVSTIR